MLSSVPGVDSPPHLPLYPPPPLEPKEEDRVSPPINDWKGDLQSDLKGCIHFEFQLYTEEPHIEVSEPVLVVKY